MAEKPEVPTTCHFTSPEKATPRARHRARGGVSRVRSRKQLLEAGPAMIRHDSRSRRCWVPEDVRRQTSIGLQAVSAGRGRRLPYDYSSGSFRARAIIAVRRSETIFAGTTKLRLYAAAEIDLAGSRNSAMMRAAIASSSVRSGGVDPGNGSATLKPSSARRGITCTW